MWQLESEVADRRDADEVLPDMMYGETLSCIRIVDRF